MKALSYFLFFPISLTCLAGPGGVGGGHISLASLQGVDGGAGVSKEIRSLIMEIFDSEDKSISGSGGLGGESISYGFGPLTGGGGGGSYTRLQGVDGGGGSSKTSSITKLGPGLGGGGFDLKHGPEVGGGGGGNSLSGIYTSGGGIHDAIDSGGGVSSLEEKRAKLIEALVNEGLSDFEIEFVLDYLENLKN